MTRISVYKLYTKSKALYIPIRQASGFSFPEKSDLENYSSYVCALGSSGSQSHLSSFKPSNTSYLRGLTASKKNNFPHNTWRDSICFYINTKPKCTYTHIYKHTHIQTLYTIARTHINNRSMALWHQKRPRVHIFFHIHDFSVWRRVSALKRHVWTEARRFHLLLHHLNFIILCNDKVEK